MCTEDVGSVIGLESGHPMLVAYTVRSDGRPRPLIHADPAVHLSLGNQSMVFICLVLFANLWFSGDVAGALFASKKSSKKVVSGGSPTTPASPPSPPV